MKSNLVRLSFFALVLGFCTVVLAEGPPAIDLTPKLPWPGDAAFPGQGPLPKRALFKSTWSDRRFQFNQTKRQDHGAIVFAGDSSVQYWQTLAQDFPGLKVANRGLNGDMTRVLWQRWKEDVLDLEPKAIVLLIGGGDISANGDPEQIAGNIKHILQATHAQNSTLPIIVCKVMPSAIKWNRPANRIKQLNALVDKIVQDEPHCVRCDTWSTMADVNGNANPALFLDLLNLDEMGYERLKAALQPILAKVSGQ